MIALPTSTYCYYRNHYSHTKYITTRNMVNFHYPPHKMGLPKPKHQHQLNVVLLGQAPTSEEGDLVFPSPAFSSQAFVPSFNQYMEMYKRSVEDPSRFWSDIAAQFYRKCRWDPSVYSGNLDVMKGNVNSFSIF